MLSRDEYRKIKSFSKAEMDKWLGYHQTMMSNQLRKQYNDVYHDELDSSIQNFITAIAYTLHFSEETNLKNDELASFMDDLFVAVEMFRKGEWKPEEYEKELKEDGIKIAEYDYDKLYRENLEKCKKQYLPYMERNEKALKWIQDFQNGNISEISLDDISKLENILRGDE